MKKEKEIWDLVNHKKETYINLGYFYFEYNHFNTEDSKKFKIRIVLNYRFRELASKSEERRVKAEAREFEARRVDAERRVEAERRRVEAKLKKYIEPIFLKI